MNKDETLALALWQLSSDTIGRLYTLADGKGMTQKAARIDHICKFMLNPVSLRKVWVKLDPVSKRAVSDAYHNDGHFNESAFSAQHGTVVPRPQAAYGRERTAIPFDLFVINNTIPGELMPLLSDLVLPVERFRVTGHEIMPEAITISGQLYALIQADTEKVGPADLLTYLQLVDQGALQWSVTHGELTAGSVRKLYEALLVGDFLRPRGNIVWKNVVRPVGLDVFARGAGWVTPTGTISDAGRRYLRTQDPELLLEGFETWLETSKFDELSRVQGLKGQKSRETYLTSPIGRRAKVIEALSWCPTDLWIEWRVLLRALLAWHFDFEVERTEYENLYVGTNPYYNLLPPNMYWVVTRGLYASAIIMDILASIGAVDISYVDESEVSFVMPPMEGYYEPLSLHDGLFLFRINNLGAYLLGQRDEYEPISEQRPALFAVDESLEARTLTTLLPNEMLQWQLLAEPLADDRYKLSAARLLTAVEEGVEIDRLATFLTEYHQGPLPAAATDWLATMSRNVGLFAEGKSYVMIRLRTPAGRDVIKGDAALSRLCRVLDDRDVLVLETNVKKVRKRLKELGYLMTSD